MSTKNGVQSVDFIIVGGGTSGLTLAARLADYLPHHNILVIEAGEDRSTDDETMMVGRWSSGFGTTRDWNLKSIAAENIGNRKVELSRARMLGGCSAINGTAMVRGVKQDYDDWHVPGWEGHAFWEDMKRCENFYPSPEFHHDHSSHGYTGPIQTQPHELAPISHKLFESLESLGIPRDDDMFSKGVSSHGCGNTVRTVHEGLRSNATAYLTKKRRNLTVICQTTVLHILIENGDSGLRTRGVLVRDQIGGGIRPIHANQEVVLSAGCYNSPHLLLVSGIGPQAHLSENGVTPTVDLPGVGQNLQDHVLVFLFYECKVPGLTLDKFLHDEKAISATLEQWKNDHTGAFADFPSGPFAFVRLDEQLEEHTAWRDATKRSPNGRDPMNRTRGQPHAEYFCTEAYFGPKQFGQFPKNGESVFGINVELFAQQSRGSVTLAGPNVLSPPIIDHAYLKDPFDLLVLTEAVKFANRVAVEGSGTKDLVAGSWPPESGHHSFQTHKDWEKFVLENATTCYHGSGTCKMGNEADAMAVVDSRLKVFGIQGLRVADCSIIPILISGHTQAPAYGIGEKAAILIAEDHYQSLEAKL